ncbi:TAP-like protein [compost metagenome]
MTAPILMLQSHYDAVTPIEGAMATLNALPNAHMMVVENEYKHGLFPYGRASVDAQVAEYFLSGRLPPGRVSYHEGKPLPMPY